MANKFGLDVTMATSDVLLDGTQTTAMLKVNGRTVGVCTSEKNHAEVNALNLVTAWHDGKLDAAQLGVMTQPLMVGTSSHFVDMFLTRSPCPACTKAILAWTNGLRSNDNLTLRLFCATIYKGEQSSESISNIKSLRAHARIEVWRWDLVGMGASKDQDSLTVLQVVHGVSLLELAPGAFNATNWPSRLGAPNMNDLPILPRNDPNNFYMRGG